MLENIRYKKILLRCDFNEPLSANDLLSTRRIDSSLGLMHELLSRGNELVLLSHHSDSEQTLLPVFKYLKGIFKEQINYLDSVDQGVVLKYFELNKNIKNKITLLENTRLFGAASGENLDESCDPSFSQFLASLGECFVFDAFSVAHREHSSTVGVAALLPSYKGLTFIKEELALSALLDNPKETLIFMGGAKLSTKMSIINNFLELGSIVCLGGAMIHPILKIKGVDIKNSYVEEGFNLQDANLDISSNNLILPKDLVWSTKEVEQKIVDNIFDFVYIEKVFTEKKIKNIMWNGPVGMYEEGHLAGSLAVSTYIKAKTDICNTTVGGGDTVTFLESNSKETDFSYISLSGGAMLKYLSGEKFKIFDFIK